jgi:predicted ATP-grasp superfamily ATP-dependent carboligase
LVVGLDCITGLQTARILSARGVPVVGVVANSRHWAAHTRSCVQVVTSPLTGAPLLEALHAVSGQRPGPAVLFPCTDGSVSYLSKERGRLPPDHRLPLSPHSTVTMLMDKDSFAEHAVRAGLPVPRTFALDTPADAAAAAAAVHYPCLLKPASKSATWLQHTKAKGFVADDSRHLLSLYENVASWATSMVVQEWVSGPETDLYSCNAYFDESGRPLATFVARKVRQWPPGVGTSASGEECRQDEVLATTQEVFGRLGFHGLAYLEMKRDARTGRLVIIEPNVGRPTGRSAIAERGGVELVYTAYRHALGLPLPTTRTQRYGTAKWVDIRRDTQAALVARRRGELSLLQWARWLAGPKAHAIWAADDPMPFAVDLAQATRTGAGRLASQLRRRLGRRDETASDRPTARPGRPRRRTGPGPLSWSPRGGGDDAVA